MNINKLISNFKISFTSLLEVFPIKFAHFNLIVKDAEKLKSPYIIFDFDGTICDSFNLTIMLLNKYRNELKIKKIDNPNKLRSMSSRSIMKELNLSYIRLPFIVSKLQKKMEQHLDKLEPFPKICEAIKLLKSKNISLILLSSNSEENISYFLKKYNISIFDILYTRVSTFGKSSALKKLIKKLNLNLTEDNIYYIGDEVRDIKACKKVNVPIISVGWGGNSYDMLQSYNPNYLCKDQEELLSILKTIISDL